MDGGIRMVAKYGYFLWENDWRTLSDEKLREMSHGRYSKKWIGGREISECWKDFT